MTPERIALIRTSFANLQPRMDEFSSRFYARLFERNPELRTLFRGDLEKQSRAMAGMIELIVKMLDIQDKLVPLIHYLGDRHAAAKVRRRPDVDAGADTRQRFHAGRSSRLAAGLRLHGR